MDREVQARNDNLRKWRRNEAKQRDVSTMVVLPNHVLELVATLAPRNLEELSRLEFLGQRRLERYGRKILEIVK